MECSIWEGLPASEEKTDLLCWNFCVYIAREVTGALRVGVKRPGPEDDHSAPSTGSRLKNECNYTSMACMETTLIVCSKMAAVFPS